MKRKLISTTLILAAALIPFGATAVAGGKPSGGGGSVNVPWSMTCINGPVNGTLTVSSKTKAVAGAANCSPTSVQNSGSIAAAFTPSSWSWSGTGCLNSIGGPMAALTGSLGQTKSYTCYVSDGSGGFVVASSGNITVKKP